MRLITMSKKQIGLEPHQRVNPADFAKTEMEFAFPGLGMALFDRVPQKPVILPFKKPDER